MGRASGCRSSASAPTLLVELVQSLRKDGEELMTEGGGEDGQTRGWKVADQGKPTPVSSVKARRTPVKKSDKRGATSEGRQERRTLMRAGEGDDRGMAATERAVCARGMGEK